MILEHCGGECHAVWPVTADGTLGAPVPCDLGNPALDEARALVELRDLHGRWPDRLSVAAHVSPVPAEGWPEDLTLTPFPHVEPEVGVLFALEAGRWEGRGETRLAPLPLGLGDWTEGRVLAPRVVDEALSFTVVHGAPASAGLPGVAPVPAGREPARFDSTRSGDALLLWGHRGPHPQTVVWRWRAGDTRPVVDTLEGLLGGDVAVGTRGDGWMIAFAEGGSRVLHHDGASWKVSRIWREPTPRCSPSLLVLAADGAVWVTLNCSARSPLEGPWRRRPGIHDVWDHGVHPSESGEHLTHQAMAVGASDLLGVAMRDGGGASLVRVHVDHASGPRRSVEATSTR